MTKVKIFRFRVSNAASMPTASDLNNPKFMSKIDELFTTTDIETIINNFIKENVDVLVDIKVNTIDENYHTNGRGNTISLVYTLTYIKLGG